MARTGRSLYFRVGALVVVGAAVAIGFILFLTSGTLRGEQTIFETYFSESVAGLDVGAPVRFRGVQVGRVTEIGLVAVVYGVRLSGAGDLAEGLVLVRFAVDPERYGRADPERAVEAGLRVRVASQGVTGLAYLEADFRVGSPDTNPAEGRWEPRYPVIPSIPSTITQVTGAAERLMAQLGELDLRTLITAATQLLEGLRDQVGERGDFALTLRESAAAMASLRNAIEGADLAATVRELREAAERIGAAGQAAETLLASPEITGAATSIGQAANDLRASVARLPAVIASLELALRTVRGTTGDAQADLGPLLRDLRATASSLRDTAEQLRRSPSQSLFGAPPPPPPRDRR